MLCGIDFLHKEMSQRRANTDQWWSVWRWELRALFCWATQICRLEIATLCLVLAAVGKVLLTSKEKGGSYPDLTSHGKLVRGERAWVRQGFYAMYDYLLTVYRISLFVSWFLLLDLCIPSNFPVEVWILSEFKSKMDFFLISHFLASGCRVVCELMGF